MTILDTINPLVRSRLDHWGDEYALCRDCEYLGHQSKNMLQVLIEHKGEMPGRQQGYKPLEVNADAQEIEDIVSRIARHAPAMAIVLRAYYCGSGRRKVERWETANMLLANAGLGVVKVPAYLDLARRGEDRVCGVLIGMARAA